MIPLRWWLGICAGLGAAGWVLLAIAASDFRRSFGASPVGALRLLALPVVLLLVLVTVLAPGNRTLLHVTAAVLALALIGCVFILRESIFVGGLGLLFLGGWFVFYWMAAWKGSPPG